MKLTFDLERYEDGRWFAWIAEGQRAAVGQGQSAWTAVADAVRSALENSDVARMIAAEYRSLTVDQRRTLGAAHALLDDVRSAVERGDAAAARAASLEALRRRRSVDRGAP